MAPTARSDSLGQERLEIEAFTRPFVAAKSPADVDRWNREWLEQQPQGESLEYFQQLRSQIAPDRTDVVAWPDLLDLDEKRDVPNRAKATV